MNSFLARLRLWRSLAIAVLALIAGGCTLSNRLFSTSTPAIYVLTAPARNAVLHASSGTVLVVYPVRADPGYDVARIAYNHTPLRLDYYAYSQWADTPARLLEPLLIRALEVDGYFKAVVTPGSGLAAGLRLDTEIVAMGHDLLKPPGEGRVAVRAQLSDLRTGEVVATRVFSVAQAVSTENALGAVTAINQALGQVLQDLVSFVVHSSANKDRKVRPEERS